MLYQFLNLISFILNENKLMISEQNESQNAHKVSKESMRKWKKWHQIADGHNDHRWSLKTSISK